MCILSNITMWYLDKLTIAINTLSDIFLRATICKFKLNMLRHPPLYLHCFG